MIEPGNDASFNVATKCGYAPIGSRTYHGAELIVLQRTALSRG